MPLLSIVIPTYNSNKYLRVLLDISSQLGHDVEFIVVDDCSDNDDIFELEVEYPSCKFIRLKDNSGAGRARNVGLSQCSGKYVCFADADDLIFVEQLKQILESLDSNVDVHFFRPSSHLPDGSPGSRHLRYANLVQYYINSKLENIRYKFHVPWSKIYKREFLITNNIRFDEVMASNDVMFSLIAGIKANTIYVSDSAFYSVLEHDASLTKNDTIGRLYDRISVAVRYNNMLKNNGAYMHRTSLIPLLFRLYKVAGFRAFTICFSVSVKLKDYVPSIYSFLQKSNKH